MATDLRALHRVAWLTLVVGCSPSFKPPAPPPEPGPVGKMAPRDPHRVTVGAGRQVLVGELCPQGAAGRPAVAPLMMRTVSWIDDASEVADAVERGSTPRFAVFGVDGKVAGIFDTLGVADVGLTQPVAAGTYVGGGPCTYDAGQGQRAENPACAPALGGCGLAVAEVSRPDDPPETPPYATGGACLSGDAIAVDIDGDGVIESFPLSGVLDGVRGPSAEWSAAPLAGAACKPTFELYDIKLAAAPEPGKAVDPKSVVTMDVMGVIDLDADGRKELVIALRFPTVRTVLVYTATGSPQRLELAGEGQSFPR